MRIAADLHTHSVASGHAYSTITEIAQEAEKKGLIAVAVTDHGPALPGGANTLYFYNMEIIPRVISGVVLIRGCEANILNKKGEIDIPEMALKRLDLVMAGIHPLTGYDGKCSADNTEAYLNVLENPNIDIICHPENANYPFDVKRVVRKAVENGKALEINNTSFLGTVRVGSEPYAEEILKEAVDCGLKISVVSDAHIAQIEGQFEKALEIINECGLPESQVINSSRENLKQFFLSRGKEVQSSF